MSLRAIAIATVLGLSALSAPESAWGQDWEQIYENDGVKVSRKDVPGSKLVAFKGDVVYDAPMGKVLYVLLDNDHRTEWVDRLYTNHIVEKKNEFDYVLYQAFTAPAILADRDFVYHGKASRDEKTGVVTLTMNSIDHPKAPETVGVRGVLQDSRYILTPVDGGAKTRVEVEIQMHPMGMIPTWVVNIIQKSWPHETLVALGGQLEKPYTLVHHLPGQKAPGTEKPEMVAADEPAPDAEGSDEGEGTEVAENAEGEEAAADGAEGDEKPTEVADGTAADPASEPETEEQPAN